MLMLRFAAIVKNNKEELDTQMATCSFTRLKESSLVPAGLLTAQFLQETLCMKPFDGRTKMEFLFIAAMEKKKSEGKSICHHSSFQVLPRSSRKAVKRSTSKFPPKNKVSINYMFCRNWAIRNPVEARLDSSSLVNKQVAQMEAT